MPENQPEAARIFGVRQGSADDAGQEGPIGGADAGLHQKDRHIGLVFGHNDYWAALNKKTPGEEQTL